MPPPYARIPEIAQNPVDLSGMVEDINIIVRALNDVLAELSVADSEFRGNDGLQPGFNANVDLKGNRLNNIARSKDDGDAVTRRELVEIGILGSAFGVAFSGPVTFAGGTFSVSSGGGGSELITEDSLEELVTAIIEGSIAVVVSGEEVSVKDFGRNGATQGTLMMARDETGEADAVRMIRGVIQFGDWRTHCLLEEILKELRRINHAST